MFDALNTYRVEKGLEPLVYSKLLEESADAKAQDLWVRGYFDHIDPDGKTPGQRAFDLGFCHEYVGENLAAGQTSVASAIRAWMESPSHNANMLEPSYVYVGMGYSVDERGRRYWVQQMAYDLPEVQEQ